MSYNYTYNPDPSGAEATVQEAFNDSKTLAADSQDRALSIIESLGSFEFNVNPLDVPNIPTPTITSLPIGEQPTEPPGLTAEFPVAPSDPTVGDLTDFSIDNAPEFTDVAPTLMEIPLPDPFDALTPAEPVLSEVVLPVDPDYVLPEVPTMLGLNLPSPPALDLPAFNDLVGDAPIAPDVTFHWSEVEYSTALLTGMNNRLVTLINGAHTGLSPEVETAIWNRGRDRQALITQRGIEEAERMTASRGFQMPSGTLVRVVQQAIQEGMRNDADLSRDVMIKQAELEQSNFQFAFNAAINLEGQLLSHFNQVQARGLDAAKFTVTAALEVFKARVLLFQADVQAFGIKAQVFETRMRAALAQLDIYKAELEAQKLIGDLNQQQVAVYVAKLEGVKAVADIYKARIEGAKVRIEADKNKVEIFRAQLQGFDSLVKAKAAEYEGYSSRVKAELTKVQMFGEQVNAFKSRTEAYGVLTNAKLNAANLDFKQTQEFPVELYKAKVGAYNTAVQAEAARIQSIAQVFKTRVEAFAAGEQAKATHTSAEVEAIKATTAVYTSQAALALQAGEINMKLAMTSAETVQASLRAAGQLSGQLAAAALAARNANASISSAASVNSSQSGIETYSDSTSVNVSHIHTYKER